MDISHQRNLIKQQLINHNIADAEIIENKIFNIAETESNANQIPLNEMYFGLAYNGLGVLFDDYDTFMKDMNDENFGWSSSIFTEFRNKIESDLDQLVSEEKVKAGNIKCGKCGSLRVSVTQVQFRSLDEGSSNCFNCADCSNSWIINN